MDYANENELTLTAFLWAKWLEEDADGIKILIITPEREEQESRMRAHLEEVAPSPTASVRDAHYPSSLLARAWAECTRTSDSIQAGVLEVTKLKLVPALPDLIQKGEYVGKFELHKTHEGVAAFHFFRGVVSLAGERITMGVPVMQDENGNNFYDLGHLDESEDSDKEPDQSS